MHQRKKEKTQKGIMIFTPQFCPNFISDQMSLRKETQIQLHEMKGRKPSLYSKLENANITIVIY